MLFPIIYPAFTRKTKTYRQKFASSYNFCEARD